MKSPLRADSGFRVKANSGWLSRRDFIHYTGAAALVAGCLPGLKAAEPENPIIGENRRRGTTDWLLTRLEPAETKEGDGRFQRRKAIEGFCSHTSIRSGETLRVFVSTDPKSDYRVEIYRMGYYGGRGARQIAALGPLSGKTQPTPEDGPKNVRECRWEPGFEWTVPESAVSGVYLGKMTAEKSGYESYIVFIVRDDRKADFLFQCSDLTWQAYNRWPAWRSLYDWKGNKWHTDPGADVSFDRPYSIYYNGLPAKFNPLTNGSGEFLLWEHPLAFWMEKEGYDVTYISNLDTHVDAEGLLRAKGFLSVGHDEYWTQAMFDNAVRARDSGLSLAFLSGNSVYHRIDLRPSSEGQPHRLFGRVQRFEREHELMGASSYGVGAADWICRRPDHWMFEGTGMKEGDGISGLVGWEYHGPPLKEDPDLEVVARGLASSENERDYAATVYPCEKGNFVFNAATCWWSMLLDSPPGFVNPPNKDFTEPDERVRRMTRNLLKRMKKNG